MSVQDPMAVAFLPPHEEWTGVSGTLRIVRRLPLVLVMVPLSAAGGAAAGAVVAPWLGVLVAMLALAATAWAWVLIGRNAASWRYAEREQDLLVSHGVLFKQLVVVPYGRMQFVDVTAGPLERRFGIATVQLHTAAAATDARIPGVPPDEAARLRDRLSALGEARSAGL